MIGKFLNLDSSFLSEVDYCRFEGVPALPQNAVFDIRPTFKNLKYDRKIYFRYEFEGDNYSYGFCDDVEILIDLIDHYWNIKKRESHFISILGYTIGYCVMKNNKFIFEDRNYYRDNERHLEPRYDTNQLLDELRISALKLNGELIARIA